MRARRGAGFSLMEVLVALAILAIALSALIGSTAYQARLVSELETRTLAGYVAANVLSEIRLGETWPATGRRIGRARLGPREWDWEAQILATEEPRLRRIEVRVGEASDRPELASLYSLSGFVGRP